MNQARPIIAYELLVERIRQLRRRDGHPDPDMLTTPATTWERYCALTWLGNHANRQAMIQDLAGEQSRDPSDGEGT